MAAWSDHEDVEPGFSPVLQRVAAYTHPLPTPCPRCNHATVGECPCVEPFPVEVWGWFDDEALGQLIKDACMEMARRSA